MEDAVQMIGGPMDGKISSRPKTVPARQLPCQVFGDHGYCYVTLDGVLAWHYIGKIKWTPEEAERRRLATN